MRFTPPEKSARAWFWRMILGPSMVIDGIVGFVLLGSWGPGLALRVARNLARARIGC